MYCINCGVKLAPTETKCPLCDVQVGQKTERRSEPALYPQDRVPYSKINKAAVNGVILFLWMLPLLVTMFVDLQRDWRLSWSWYVGGAMVLSYVIVALPMWFQRPNPVVFVPCDFVAVAAFVWMIAWLNGGDWYLSFALPVIGCLAVVITAVVALCRYLKKGRLYVLGGAMIALGGVMLLVEELVMWNFSRGFVGWSVYPLITFLLLGGMLIFLGINKTARERMERRFFF